MNGMKKIDRLSKDESRMAIEFAVRAERDRVASVIRAYENDENTFDDADAPAEWAD